MIYMTNGVNFKMTKREEEILELMKIASNVVIEEDLPLLIELAKY